MVHPDKRQVIAFAPEPVANTDGNRNQIINFANIESGFFFDWRCTVATQWYQTGYEGIQMQSLLPVYSSSTDQFRPFVVTRRLSPKIFTFTENCCRKPKMDTSADKFCSLLLAT